MSDGAEKKSFRLIKPDGSLDRGMGVSIHDIKLGTVPEAINTFEKLFIAFYEGKIDREKYGVLMYGFNVYVSLMRLAKELELEKTFERIEAKIEEIQRQRGEVQLRLPAPG